MQYLLLIYDEDKRFSNGYSAAELGEYRTFGKEFAAAILQRCACATANY